MTDPLNRYAYDAQRLPDGRYVLRQLEQQDDVPRADWPVEIVSSPLRISRKTASELAVLLRSTFWDGRQQGRQDERPTTRLRGTH